MCAVRRHVRRRRRCGQRRRRVRGRRVQGRDGARRPDARHGRGRHRQRRRRHHRRGRRGRPELPHARRRRPLRGGAVVESINGLFEIAILTGGRSNNTLVVNDSDNVIYVGGVARAVTPWQGRVTLDIGRQRGQPVRRELRDHDDARQRRAHRDRRHRRRLRRRPADRLRHQPGRRHRR